MAPGEFSPQSVFFDFGFAQAVVVGGDIRFERRFSLFHAPFLKQLVQECGLGVQLALACFLLQIRETRRRERECAPLLSAWISVRHSTSYHIIGMIITATSESPRLRAAAELRSAWTGQRPVPTRAKPRRGKPRLYRKIVSESY